MKIYISGPITGVPNLNREAFTTATKTIKILTGGDVVNPHDLCADIPEGSSWEVYMCRCVEIIPSCDAYYLIPGWEKSKGANLEVQILNALGKKRILC